MAHFRTNFASLLQPDLRKVLFEEWDRRPTEYTEVYNVLNSQKSDEIDTKVGGFGLAPEISENDPIPFETAKQDARVTYTHLGYALGFKVTSWMMEDDLYNIMNRLPRKLAISMMQTVETQAAALWNDAFAGATFTGIDGKAMVATNHDRLDGGTWTNRLAVDADLTKTSLQNLWTLMENTVDDNNLALLIIARKIIVHPDEWFNALELLNSIQTPDSQDNNVNSLRNLNLQLVKYHYLTDSDAWFLQSDIHEVNFFWRRQMTFSSEDDFDTEASKHKASMRFSNGFTDARGVAGTPGA